VLVVVGGVGVNGNDVVVDVLFVQVLILPMTIMMLFDHTML
jgi:hypothetical protein